MKGTGITWESDWWTQSTCIFYAGEEIGFLKMNMWGFRKAKAVLLDREYEIKPTNFWETELIITDKANQQIIATLTINMWNNKTQLYVPKDNETFIFKKNFGV